MHWSVLTCFPIRDQTCFELLSVLRQFQNSVLHGSRYVSELLERSEFTDVIRSSDMLLVLLAFTLSQR